MVRGASEENRQARWRGFSLTVLASVLAVSFTAASFNFWRDPYWVLRDDPPWTRGGEGASRLLDVAMRRAKPLQMARIRPHSVLLGSSVVYRGLDTRDLGGGVYNAGLSSLMASELPVMAGLIADLGSVRRVAVGLDYFMFSALPPPPPVRPALATANGRREALLATLLSREALEATMLSRVRGMEPGLWRREGFKTTPDFDAMLTRRVHAAQEVAAMAYRTAGLARLSEALGRLARQEVVIYLSPMSAVQRDLLRVAGRQAELARWRADVALLAGRHGVALHDLLDTHPFEDFDPERGSSRYWIDNMHFKPEVGRWVLARLGWL